MKSKFILYHSAFFLLISVHTFAQSTCNVTYAVNNAVGSTPGMQRELVRVDPVTGATSFVADLFASAPANTAPSMRTSAIALDGKTNTIWYITRDGGPRIYSYNITTGAYGGNISIPSYGSSSPNLNKAAFNPIDGKLYFHSGQIGDTKLWAYDPKQPASASNPLNMGSLTVPGHLADDLAGGDIAFDGLGNLTGVFSPGNFMAVFPANYNASNVYTGFSTTGQVILPLTFSSPSSVSFVADGSYIVGKAGSGFYKVNTNTGSISQLATGFNPSDLASCAAPAPSISSSTSIDPFVKTATATCLNGISTVQYKITVRNAGQFVATNTILKDVIPAGMTVTSGTLNGIAISGLSNATLANGILIKSPGTVTAGVLGTDAPAEVIILATVPLVSATYSNQAFLTYQGIETNPEAVNNRLASDDPTTIPKGDVTTITTGICNPMPVTLTSFKASAGEIGSVLLHWETTSETNSKSFEVEHSTNGKNWNLIATVAAGGESQILEKYDYTHINPANGENLYRLRMVDLDESFSYSRIVKQSLVQSLKVFFSPNPAVSLIKVNMDGAINWEDVKDIKIYNLNGRVVYTASKLVDGEINVGQLSAGTYIVAISHKNGQVYNSKVSVVR